jgi:hypothetical protein
MNLTEDEQRIVDALLKEPHITNLALSSKVYMGHSALNKAMTSIYVKFNVSHVRGRKKRKALLEQLQKEVTDGNK